MSAVSIRGVFAMLTVPKVTAADHVVDVKKPERIVFVPLQSTLLLPRAYFYPSEYRLSEE